MPAPAKQPVSLTAVSLIIGAVFVLLIGLVIWQPKAAIWIADAVEAEHSAQSSDQADPVKLAAVPKRRPVDPGQWAQVLKQNVVEETGSLKAKE